MVANTINIGADLGAMAAALNLVVGGPSLLYVVLFAAVTVLLEVFVRYARYVSVLKWLTLSLFAYVGVALLVQIPWGTVGYNLIVPKIQLTPAYFTVVVAILGTTISPYLFFWQAEEEVGLSNAVALFIVLTTSATLNARGNGYPDLRSGRRGAAPDRRAVRVRGLRPWRRRHRAAGAAVLASSAAYALGETFGWHVGLARKLKRAKAFYAAIGVATLVGVALNFSPIDPMQALFWTAVINGVVPCR